MIIKHHKATVRKRANMKRVEDWWIDGITNQTQMGKWLGVSQVAVSNYMRDIQRNWAREDSIACRANRQRHIRAQFKLIRQAAEEFEVSKVERKRINCEECKGKGYLPKQGACETCQGEGKVEIEIRVPGSSKYLRVIQDGIKELAKLDGSYPDLIDRRTEGDRHLHLHEAPRVSILDGATDEQILEYRAYVDRLQLECEKNGNGNRQAIIEVGNETVEANEGSE